MTINELKISEVEIWLKRNSGFKTVDTAPSILNMPVVSLSYNCFVYIGILFSLCDFPLLLENDAFNQILFLLEKHIVNLVLFHPEKIINISYILHFCIKT